VSPQRIIALSRAGALGLGVALAVFAGWGSPSWWALPVLTIAIMAAQMASVRIVVGRQAAGFTLEDAFVVMAFILAPGAWIVVAAVVGGILAKFRRMAWIKLSFNSALLLLGFSVGVYVTELVGGGVVGALIGMVAYSCVNLLVVTIPLAVSSGVSYPRMLRMVASVGVVANAGNASVGLLAGWLALNAPLGLLGLVVPIALLWRAYQQQTLRAAEARLFAELARGQEQVAGGTVDASAQVVVTAAARLFGGAEVEMLLRHPDSPVQYLGDEHGLSARLRAEADAFDAPWVLRALSERGVRTGTEGDRPYCSAVLGDPARPVAVLIARRPSRAPAFNRADAQLAEVLVGQAEAWLSVADLTARHEEALGRAEAYGAASRVLGDLGQETVPALAVLRESANRLSRLASAFNGPGAVDEIVAELHAVERAVASLLGAIALASDPIAADGSDVTVLTAGGVRGETEWTTTGRLEDAVRL
jgi:hypothetical protein